VWSGDGLESSSARPVAPDLQDAVIVAALRRRIETAEVAA
jgi:hypothetical protein